jgi:hypothetical protein
VARKFLVLAALLLPATAVSAQQFNPYDALDANPWMGHNLWGAAQVIRAQAAAAKDRAIAKRLNEKAKQEAIITKQREVEHTKWMLDYKPYEADFEKRRQEEAYRMQMTGATAGDIVAGYALNTLMRRMETQITLLETDRTPLPEPLRNGYVAKRVNFSDGTSNSSEGLLLLEKINWQGVLQEDVFEADRKAVESLLVQAREAGENNKSTYALQKKLKDHLAHMEYLRFEMQHSDKQRVEMYPHMQAIRQLNQLQDSIKLLTKGNLSETLFLKRTIDADTIGKLVTVLRDRGWQFAPATEGNEAVYTALYKAMRQSIDNGRFQ